MGRKIAKLNGKIYGRLTVISFHSRVNKRTHWNCLCSCGKYKIIAYDSLKNGANSCGCLKTESNKARAKHGRHGTKEYRTWIHILNRCSDKDNINYGGRGIKVCDKWSKSFEAFFNDMGQAPSPKHSIDRKDTNGNYEPLNCRWATSKEQNNNRRNNKIIQWNGQNKTLIQWCELLNLHYDRTRSRINSGWSVESAFSNFD